MEVSTLPDTYICVAHKIIQYIDYTLALKKTVADFLSSKGSRKKVLPQMDKPLKGGGLRPDL